MGPASCLAASSDRRESDAKEDSGSYEEGGVAGADTQEEMDEKIQPAEVS